MAELRPTTRDAEELAARVRTFLASDRPDAVTMRGVLEHVAAHFPVGIVGGMLRDLALGGPEAFRSDLDLAILPADPQALQNFLEGTGWLLGRTSFGGFRVRLPHAQVDLFALSEVWSVRAGYVRARGFEDWPNLPSLSWDTAAYDAREQKVYTSAVYFSALGDRVLELNEPHAAHPKRFADRKQQLAIRARKLLARWDANSGPVLTELLRACPSEEATIP